MQVTIEARSQDIPPSPSSDDTSINPEHNAAYEGLNNQAKISTPKQPSWSSDELRRFPLPRNGNPWEQCHLTLKEYDKGTQDAWKDEIDKLLIFAGLFSAVVTAFTIESYKWLQTDNPEIDALTLKTIQMLVVHAASNQGSNNTQQPYMDLAIASFQKLAPRKPSSTVVHINIFWFLSLTISLSTVLVGTLCLQWLREFSRIRAMPYKEAIALRQMRYEGFSRWRLPVILSSLPLLLQFAVILFFAGLLELLWTLHRIVAIIVTIAIGVTVLFALVTTVAPFCQYLLLQEGTHDAAQCPFKSPQSWAFYRLGTFVCHILTRNSSPTSNKWTFFSAQKIQRALYETNWTEHDIHLRQRFRGSKDLTEALVWLDNKFSGHVNTVRTVYHCLLDLDVPTAAEVVRQINPFGSERLNNILDGDPNQPTSRRQDNVLATYLERHRRSHNSINTAYIETVIRIMNRQDYLPVADWPVINLENMPEEIVEQFLMSSRSMLSREILTTSNVIAVWGLIQRIFQRRRGKPEAVSSTQLDLSFSIIEEFRAWIKRQTPGLERRDRISLCVYGMLKVFPPSFDFHDSILRQSGLEKAVHLAQALDAQLYQLEGGLAVLAHQRWRELIERCSMVVGAWKSETSGEVVDPASVEENQDGSMEVIIISRAVVGTLEQA